MTMQKIINSLGRIGPMSGAELAQFIGITHVATNKQLRQLRNLQSVHITRYERQPDGKQGRCIPVYALGNLADAAPLKMRNYSDISKRYYQRHRMEISVRRYHKQRTYLGAWAGLGEKPRRINIYA